MACLARPQLWSAELGPRCVSHQFGPSGSARHGSMSHLEPVAEASQNPVWLRIRMHTHSTEGQRSHGGAGSFLRGIVKRHHAALIMLYLRFESVSRALVGASEAPGGAHSVWTDIARGGKPRGPFSRNHSTGPHRPTLWWLMARRWPSVSYRQISKPRHGISPSTMRATHALETVSGRGA